jgi:glycine cleavage system H protein
MKVPGCDTFVALDRLYSADHIWVLKMANGVVQIGASDPFQATMANVVTCSLLDPGTVLHTEDPFGYIEAEKMNVDLLSPVSGTILTINTDLMSAQRGLSPINSDPYGSGWMATIQMSNPSDLNNLYSAQYYAYLESGKNWTGPVPPMH